MLHGTLQTESGGRVSGRLIYWKMHNELMQAASVKPDTLLFVKAQLGWSSFAVHFWKTGRRGGELFEGKTLCKV